MAWRQYAQTESQKKVFALAEEMLKRVGEFVKCFDKVGKDIYIIQKDFFDAHKKSIQVDRVLYKKQMS
jgi:DNA recombination protein RmuC